MKNVEVKIRSKYYEKRKRMAKRKKYNGLEALIILIASLIMALIKFIIRIILFIYDVITIYTSKYRIKSGNGFFKTYFNKGNYGEFKLYRKVISKFGKDKVYTNVYLDNVNTDYTEIDVIALSSHGIYVFEMKNYSGYIYGSENDQHWTQVLNRFSKNKFYNPLRQNYAHTKSVEKYLAIHESEIIPVIVFSNHSKLSKIDVGINKNVFQIKDINRFIKNNFKGKKVTFTNEKLNEFSVKLIEHSNMSQEIKDKHIIQVTNIQKNGLKSDKFM
jgi:hypothetical protein